MKNILLIVVVVIILGGLFYLFAPKNMTMQSPSTATTPTAMQPKNKLVTIVVKQGKIVSGPNVINLNQGDTVTLKATVDEDEEIHIHGYDKKLEVQKDKPAQITFTANLSGRFPFELENESIELGAFQVQPK